MDSQMPARKIHSHRPMNFTNTQSGFLNHTCFMFIFCITHYPFGRLTLLVRADRYYFNLDKCRSSLIRKLSFKKNLLVSEIADFVPFCLLDLYSNQENVVCPNTSGHIALSPGSRN